jgi:hypothetical protein
LDQSQQEPTLVLTGEGITESVRMFLPHKWSTSSVPGNAGDALQIVVIEKQRFPFAFGNESSSHTFRLSRWPQAKMESISEYNLWTLPAVVALQPPVRSGAVPYVAAWCPAFEAVAISAAAITKEVQTMRLPIHEIHARYQAKLQIFDRLMNVIIPGEAADASTDNGNTDQEISRESKIQSLQNQFGGKLLYLVADSAAQ